MPVNLQVQLQKFRINAISYLPRFIWIHSRYTNMSSQHSSDKLDRIVAQARREREERENGYREQALKLYPWVCGRCAREFTRENLRELTVHHRDHNHDNNPPDGSNWELLCIYCHDNEHSRLIDSGYGDAAADSKKKSGSFNPFANLKDMLEEKK